MQLQMPAGMTRGGLPNRLMVVRSQSASTFLEVILAMAIGLLLIGALYVATRAEMRRVDEGREMIERSSLVCALLNRIEDDVTACVQPSTLRPPSREPAPGAPDSVTVLPKIESLSAPLSPSPFGTDGNPVAPIGGPAVPEQPPAVSHGMQGGANALNLHVSIVPRQPEPTLRREAFATGESTVSGDLHRITYWLIQEGRVASGLARHEVNWTTVPTVEDAHLPPDESPDLISAEVKDLQFSYFDGHDWLDRWESSALASDGKPVGLPAAIAVTLGFGSQNPDKGSDDKPSLRYYRHVIAIQSTSRLPR